MTESIVLGGGCFWCVEAAFKELDGVTDTTVGYAGGETDDPTYREVCTGETGHAEVVKVEFEPEEVSLKEVLQLFFRIHDPTTKDREGPDVGSQYRSMVLYSDREQQRAVESFLDSARGRYEDGIVTEVRPLEEFHRAEEKHQDYFEKNPDDSYCRMHAAPKARKAREF